MKKIIVGIFVSCMAFSSGFASGGEYYCTAVALIDTSANKYIRKFSKEEFKKSQIMLHIDDTKIIDIYNNTYKFITKVEEKNMYRNSKQHRMFSVKKLKGKNDRLLVNYFDMFGSSLVARQYICIDIKTISRKK